MRPFNLHDLPALYAYRDQIVSLDSAYHLTRGQNFLAPSILFDQLYPGRESYLAVEDNSHYHKKLLGRLVFDDETRCAQISFVMPQTLSGTAAMQELVDDLYRQAGEWGAVNVRAEAEVGAPVFSVLRKCGFQVYDRQRVWMLTGVNDLHALKLANQGWEHCMELDQIAVRHLYYSTVPPMVQAAQPLLPEKMNGMVYWQDGEVLGYLESTSGANGIYLKILLHPAIENSLAVLRSAFAHFFPLLGRPIYVAVPAYQGRLDATMYEMQAQVVSLRTLMVRYVAQPLRVIEWDAVLRRFEHSKARASQYVFPGE